MPIVITWLIPDKILISHWTGTIGVQDMHYLTEELAIVFNSVSAPVHTLIDMSDMRDLEPEAVYAYLTSPITNHPHRGRIAIIGMKPDQVGWIQVANQFAQREIVRLFSTFHEARAFLLEHDTPPPSLDNAT